MKKNTLIAVVFFCFHFVTFSQFGLENLLCVSSNDANSIQLVDFDNDSDLDVLYTAQYDKKMVWVENLGNGSFGQQNLITNFFGDVEYCTASDLDNDGLIDVLSATNIPNQIGWYKNLGDGIFGPIQVLPYLAGTITSIQCSDINGDGYNDVITTREDEVEWNENLGNGTFGSQQIITSTAFDVQSVACDDIDGDGDVDVLVPSYGGNTVSWYENLGLGVFGTGQLINNTTSPHGSCLSDIDGDNDLDVLITSMSLGEVMWYENLGSGVFGPEQIVSPLIISPSMIRAIDVDNDGDPDPITISSNNGMIIWNENFGGGAFGPNSIISSQVINPKMIAVGDIDSNGTNDVITASMGDDLVFWYSNSGNGVFSSEITVVERAEDVLHTMIADMDNDGKTDIVYLSQGDSKISWNKNLGNGNFGDRLIISNTAVGARDMDITDFNSDGFLDIVSIRIGTDDVVWYENLGNGTFSNQLFLDSYNSAAEDVLAIDLNSNGLMDILVAESTSADLFLYTNLGGGTFSSGALISNSVRIATMVKSDFDGDNDEDIFYVSNTPGASAGLFYIENIGGGNVSSEVQISNMTTFADICMTDFDGDNDPDIITSSGSSLSPGIFYFENLGNGNFASVMTIPGQYSAYPLLGTDLNEDGYIDILTKGSGAFNQSIVIHEQQSPGVFLAPQGIVPYDHAPGSILTNDIDNDGDLDIIYSSRQDDKVAIVENYRLNNIQIEGKLFFDSNQNAMLDSSEIGFPQINVFSTPLSDFTFTYGDGNYFMNFNDSSGVYLLAPNIPDYWSISTDSLSYNVVVDSSHFHLDSLNFGFYPDTIVDSLTLDFVGGFPRCDQIVNYWLNIENNGTTLPSGIIHLELDPALTYINSSVIPDSISGQDVYWNFDSLSYFSDTTLNLSVLMPDFNSIGDTLISSLETTLIDSLGTLGMSSIKQLKQELVCAYDPNDKIVYPAGIGTQGYILPETPFLDYVVRFQNTGTDTALNVQIIDQLDLSLDWQTLEILSSSDPIIVNVEQNGEVTFDFIDIMLPDSNVNEIASHGYVSFRIHLIPNLALGTVIENFAGIYFDNNPAVITNSTVNTLDICFSQEMATISDFTIDTVCINSTPIVLPTGSPSGGSYVGTGIVAGEFIPFSAGLGEHYIYYNYTDSLGCYSIDSTIITVDACANMVQLPNSSIKMYPNPTRDYLTLEFIPNESHVFVYDAIGRVVYSDTSDANGKITIPVMKYGKGVLIIRIKDDAGTTVFNSRVIIQ